MEKSAQEQVANGDFVTGNFTIQAQMPMGKSITVSGYVYSKNSPDEINKQINLLHDAVDYQRSRAEIPELEVKLEQRYKALKDLRDALAGLLTRQDSGSKLTSQEKKAIGDMSKSVEHLQADIEKGEEAIRLAKDKVGM